MIVNNNNNNQDISFISNSKEAENLLEINSINNENSFNYNKNIGQNKGINIGNYQKEKNLYGISFRNQIENNN